MIAVETEVQALRRVRRLSKRYYSSPKFQNAFVDGGLAKLAGRTADSCPYPRDPGKTWSAVYRKAWLKGFASASQ